MGLRATPALKAYVAIMATDYLYAEDVHYMDGIMHTDSWMMSHDLYNSMPGAPEFILDEAWLERRQRGALRDRADLVEAVREGAVGRLRPKVMTVTTIIVGLLPILWGHGTGASVMKRIAAPMVGGMVSATLLTLVVVPVIYFIWQNASIDGVKEDPRRV